MGKQSKSVDAPSELVVQKAENVPSNVVYIGYVVLGTHAVASVRFYIHLY